MFRHVRVIILFAIAAAVLVGLTLPGPRKPPEKAPQISQISID